MHFITTRKILIYLSVGLWLSALMFPVFPARWFATGGDPGQAYVYGWYCALFGFFGPTANGLFGWFSNGFLGVAAVFLAQCKSGERSRRALLFIFIALLISTSTFYPDPSPPLMPNLVANRGRETVAAIISSLGVGYWLWLSSFLAMGAAAFSRTRSRT